MKMPIQLFCGDIEPQESLIRPIQNKMFVKASGGLWTSNYVKECGSDWVRAYEDMFGIPDEGLNGWLLTPSSDARIYTVDSLEDLIWLLDKYEYIQSNINFGNFIDYEKMALDYDAMHLTEKGQWETRYSNPSFYGWDCQSTHWFKLCFEKVEYIGKVK